MQFRISPREVSFDDEMLILVDHQDRVVGHGEKHRVHRGGGILHRALSVFLFSRSGRVLLQRRSAEKPLWPLYWTNTCCSHPRAGENCEAAAHRRLREELGVDAPLERIFRFEYAAAFGDVGSEREVCTVFVGSIDDDAVLDVNPNEIAEVQWLEPSTIDREIAERPGRFTPWFLIEWRRVRNRRANPARLAG